MKYKFKVGDKVRIKPSVDLQSLGIISRETIADLMESELTITNDKPGCEGWCNKGIDGTPTYTVGTWRIPQSFLRKVNANTKGKNTQGTRTAREATSA